MAQPYTGGMTHGQAGFYGGKQQRIFLPRTKLGDMVDKYLFWVFCEEEEEHMSLYAHRHKDDVETLIKDSGEEDIAAFYEDLNGSFMGSLSFFSGTGVGGIRSSYADVIANGPHSPLKNTKGSAIDQMKVFVQWYQVFQDCHGYGWRVEGLDWLITKFEEKKSN